MEHVHSIQNAMKKAGLSALLLTDPISCRYATGFYYTDGACLIGPDKAWLLTDSRYTEAASAQVHTAEVRRFTTGKPLMKLAAELAEGLEKDAFGAEENRMSHADWLAWEEALGCGFKPCGELLTGLRAVKDEDEVKSMIAAQRIADKSLAQLVEHIRPGRTEKEVAAELTYLMLLNGGEENSFDPIVVTGAKSSLPHGVPGDKVIAKGDFLTIDFGTKFNGYCSDTTRTFAIGEADGQMREVYEVVLMAQLAGIAAARAGIIGHDLDAAARKVIEDAGYGEYFGHSLGHSLGLEIHENPGARPTCNTALPAGLAVSQEPGIYLPGRFGVRIEDVVILREGGCEDITGSPKELTIL